MTLVVTWQTTHAIPIQSALKFEFDLASFFHRFFDGEINNCWLVSEEILWRNIECGISKCVMLFHGKKKRILDGCIIQDAFSKEDCKKRFLKMEISCFRSNSRFPLGLFYVYVLELNKTSLFLEILSFVIIYPIFW